MIDTYILDDDKNPIPASLEEYVKWKLENNIHVGKDEIGGVRVSTVFLGIDHQFGKGPPILWETMIFGGQHNEAQSRYASHDDALKGHQVALERVKDDAALDIAPERKLLNGD